MRLINKLLLRTSLTLILVLSLWAGFFYYALINEINDETDDALELHSELLIKRILAGEALPERIEGSNNVFFFQALKPDEFLPQAAIAYRDSMIYIPEKKEYEPARVLETIYRDRDDQYHKLTVLTPTIEKKDLIEAIWSWISFLYLGLLATLIFVNLWVFYGSLKPLQRLMHWLESYQLGAKNQKLEIKSEVSEFKKLKESLARHIQRAEEVYEEQKVFIGNASHEMQTPLAILSNRLEWLLDKTELDETQMLELLKMKQTLVNLARLNKSLLFLSRIENQQFPERSLIAVNRLIREQLPDYKDIYAYKSLTLKLEEEADLELEMNETLARSLLNNLLKNSFVHSPTGGEIRIHIQAQGLSISNLGQGTALDGEKIFQRFYQSSTTKSGAGLGLVIAKSIASRYRMELSYAYKPPYHQFLLRLPY